MTKGVGTVPLIRARVFPSPAAATKSMRTTLALLLAVALLAVGCGTTRPKEGLTCHLDQYIEPDDPDRPYALSKRSLRFDNTLQEFHPENPDLNVLVLSAGGQFGAFGAGFLKGWGSLGDKAQPFPRDQINVVTGVSTGAVLATHAFLGGKRDEDAYYLYTHIGAKDVYEQRSMISLIWANSYFDTKKKDQLLAKYVTPLIDEVKANVSKNRKLMVGAVDLDSGKFVRINLTDLAASQEENRETCYVEAVGASSAIPIAFEPKFIDGRILVDGGARVHLFLNNLDEVHRGKNVKRRMVVLLHSDFNVGCPTLDKVGILQVAGRTAAITSDQLIKDSVYQTDYFAKHVGADKEFDTWYVDAAEATAKCKQIRRNDIARECGGPTGMLKADDMFCHPLMECLAEEGVEAGKKFASSQGWKTKPSDLDLGSDQCRPVK
jgi:predicted patatin/cPLA2 family phospholipase